MTTDIVPVLLGADLNCYGVARAFFEKYGVVSHAFGKYPLGVTDKCKFIKFTSVPDLSDYAVADRILLDFAKEQKGKKLYIVGCTDEYAEYIIERQDTLKEYYFVSVVDKEKKDILINKESFYALCEEYSLPYPKTKVIKHGEKNIFGIFYSRKSRIFLSHSRKAVVVDKLLETPV